MDQLPQRKSDVFSHIRLTPHYNLNDEKERLNRIASNEWVKKQQQLSSMGVPSNQSQWKPDWTLMNRHSITSSDQIYQKSPHSSIPSRLLQGMKSNQRVPDGPQNAWEEKLLRNKSDYIAADASDLYHHQVNNNPGSKMTANMWNSNGAAVDEARDQMIWSQFIQQYSRAPLSPKEFQEYKRVFLSQFETVSEQMERRQFEVPHLNNQLDPNRDAALKWINGDDLATHYRDRATWQYQKYGDPMAAFITNKAYR